MARGRPNSGKGPGRGVKPSKTAAWQWTEDTEPKNITQENIETAYCIDKIPCLRGACRVNCKFNPNCLNGLGEKLWLGEIQDNYWHNLEDPEDEKREKDAFVGLKNLGATCYVNTFLQLWFHNTRLRSALYYWTNLDSGFTQDETHNCTKNNIGDTEQLQTNNKSSVNEESLSTKKEVPSKEVKAVSNTAVKQMPPLLPSSCLSTEDADKFTNICAHLQLIFAQLQYSSRRYIDPTSLIHSLGLDTAQQQDAQEFSKLFMSLLESTLSEQPNPEVREVIQNQFGGEYFYVTKCDKCGNKSKQLSKFYELDLNIQGHTSLSQCIKEFLKEEELSGDNQYYCTACNSKQNAKRYIEIQSLPPVLNLQLLRFVFDRKTGYKKKLHSHVQFPDVLNMNEILKDGTNEENAPEYELTAVLMHHGTSAYSGHYVAHIRDKETDTWYKFNDEDIEKMQNKLKLSGEDDSCTEPGEKPAKRPKCSKGYHTSRNAYMLVYTRKTAEDLPNLSVEVPEHLQELVAKDNSRFEEWIVAMNYMKDEMISKGKSLQAEVKSMHETLPVKGDDYEWISSEWLRMWLNDRKEDKPPIDNSSLLCSHGKFNPQKVPNAKRISRRAADLFYEKFGGFPRLQRDSLCLECVRLVCSQIRFKFRISEDDKAIRTIIKNKPDPRKAGKWYWVGKNSLVSWKRLATLEKDTREQKTSSYSVYDSEVLNSTTVKQQAEQKTRKSTNGVAENNRKRKKNPSISEGDSMLAEEKFKELTAAKRIGSGSHALKQPCINSDLCDSKQQCIDGGSCSIKQQCLNRDLCASKQQCINSGSCALKQLCIKSDSCTSKQQCIDSSSCSNKQQYLNRDLCASKQQCINSDSCAVKKQCSDGDSCTGGNSRGEDSGQMKDSTGMEDGGRTNVSSDEEEEDMQFNEDILCEHGNLSTNASSRKLIQESIWKRLSYYFDAAREFDEDHPICLQCQAENEDERKIQKLNKLQASEERSALSYLYYNKHRPNLHSSDEEPLSSLCVYAVNNSFLDLWRSFLRNCNKCPRPDSICNQDLLCPHLRFMFNPQLHGEDGSNEVFSYLFKHEWDIISNKYPYDEIITVTMETTADGEDCSFVISPEICGDCHASRMLEKARSFENYRHATIFVRKITDEHDPIEIQRHFDEETTDPDSPQDPDYSSSDNKTKSSSENSKRRSSRHRKQRGEVNLTVHSSQTLRDIKLELMKSFSVMPMDQHLSLKGTPLTDDAATLSRLGVRPGCLLMLKLDQPQGGGHPETFLAATTVPEKGFQGTGLLGH